MLLLPRADSPCFFLGGLPPGFDLFWPSACPATRPVYRLFFDPSCFRLALLSGAAYRSLAVARGLLSSCCHAWRRNPCSSCPIDGLVSGFFVCLLGRSTLPPAFATWPVYCLLICSLAVTRDPRSVTWPINCPFRFPLRPLPIGQSIDCLV